MTAFAPPPPQVLPPLAHAREGGREFANGVARMDGPERAA